ncbi:MAG: FIST C-terminal domain-containing protein [Deltaproteobacteria bacterium]|nr:FIST C-terminal domain-containing protein [Deltaproteobacteria bacterium]
MERLRTWRAATTCQDESEAVEEVRQQVGEVGNLKAVIFFCSPRYDRERLAAALQKAFSCPIIGCTSAGQIGPRGFQPEGLCAVALASDELDVHTYLIEPLGEVRARALEVAARVRQEIPGDLPQFGLVLVDGLSMAEEELVSTLHLALDGMSLVGGSAGDDLAFERTFVYGHGVFRRDAAVLAVFRTSLPFQTLKFQHFVPTARKLVATAAYPDRRLVEEFNGKRAARAYAEAVGVPVEGLDASVFSAHPLLIEMAGEYHVRSIQRVNPDASLSFYCAIDEALVFTVGQGVDALETADLAMQGMRAAMGGEPQVVIGCDCILRRLELEQAGLSEQVGALFAKNRVLGFSTYGEQWNGMHMNQTFTGVALGG